MDLGDLYKNSGDDYRRDKKLFGDEDEDDEEDLSPTRGYNDERLPALENAVENSAYKLALVEPVKYSNPIPSTNF